MFARRQTPKDVSVYLGGYTFDEAGIRMWPLRRFTAQWRDLADFQLNRIDGERAQYTLVLTFSSRRKPVSVAFGGGAKNVRRLAVAFRWIGAAIPNLAASKRLFVVELCASENRVTDELLGKTTPSDQDRLDRARFWWLALNPKKAIKECAPILAGRGPLEVEAALVTIDGLLASGKPDSAVDALENILPRHRDNPELVGRCAALLLDLDDPRGEQMAEEVFTRKIAPVDVVGLHWSAHYFRRKQWDRASAILDRLERTVATISPDLADEIARVRREIAELKASPAVAFRRINVRSFLLHLVGWGVPFVLLGLLAFPIYLVGPLFYKETQTLRRLQDQGVRVDSANVHDLFRRDEDGTMLSQLIYEFAPDPASARPREISPPAAYTKEAFDAYRKEVEDEIHGILPRGWYRGRSILYEKTARAIEQDFTQHFVTFLPDDPSINTVGPITSTRIWLTWLAGGKATVMAVAAVGMAAFIAVQYALGRLRRWSVGKRPL